VSVEFVLVAAAAYGALYFALGNVVLPGQPAFSALLIWLTAVVSADIAAWVSEGPF